MPGKAAAQRRPDPTTNSSKTYTKKQFMDFYGEFNGPKMWKKAGQAPAKKGGGGGKKGGGKKGGAGGGEKRRDPTVPKSKKTYSKQQFVDFYGKKNGLKVWKMAGAPAKGKGKKGTGKKTPAKKEKKEEKRRDPTNPKSKATYTLKQFVEFYGKKNGPKVWAKAPRKKQIVLVTGATGRIGKEVIAHLAKNKSRFIIRACSHNPDKADYLKKIGATQIVKFDYTDPETWKAACKGVEFVYSSSLDPLLEHHLKFCEYLGTIRKQLKLVVRVSCMGADTNTASYDAESHYSRKGAGIPLMLQHYWWGEKSLIDAKVPTCVLRNNFFMNHLLKTDQENIQKESGAFFSNPLGETRNSFVCTNDIGYAAAVIFRQGPKLHKNKFYDITGPESQSMYEIAEVLGEVLGKKIEYKPQDAKQFEADFGPVRAAFFEYLSNGFYGRCSPDFYNITGKKPTSYKQYLTTKGAAGDTGIDELWQGNLWKKGVDAMKDAAKVGK